MKTVRIYSDGSSKGTSDGPGGYGTIVQYLNDDGTTAKVMEYTEGFKVTTNNRMELMGVIVGLESLTEPYNVMVYSDSKYVVDAFNQRWINNWLSNGWHTSLKKPVKNIDLWKRLLNAKKPHEVKFAWVKGHDGHADNERCDYLAQSSADGVEFERKPDGTLQPKTSLKEDENYKPEENKVEFTLESLVDAVASDEIQSVAIKDKVITINGVKFIFDEEGNVGPHPDEDIEKCKKVYEELKETLKNFDADKFLSNLFSPGFELLFF